MTSRIISETDRLILRRFEKKDLQDLFEYLSNANIVKYEPYKAQTFAEAEEQLNWRISTDEMVAVELKDSKKVIGNIYLGKSEINSLEIGFVFNEKYWRKGYAKESCERLINIAFSEGINRIFAHCDPKNIDSWKLLESLGFERETHLKHNIYFWKDEEGNPIWKDTYIYSKTNKI